MSQTDVIQTLKKNRFKWLTATEIADELKANRNSISTNIARLNKANMLKSRIRKTTVGSRQSMEYKYKK